MKKISMLVLFGLLIITACSPANNSVVPISSSTPRATAEVKSLPTPVSSGKTIVYDTLQVAMSGAEITTSYLTEYDSTREPPAGKKFVWIHLLIRNASQGEGGWTLPAPEHFSVLLGDAEFKSTYGHRKDHADYMTLDTNIVRGQDVDAWLRFDVPAEAELQGLIFAFLPESSQVSLGFSSSEFFWADHPIYLWNCAP